MTSKDHPFWGKNRVTTESCSPIESDGARASTASHESSDKGMDVATCRVCHCVESDRKGEIALGFLGISPSLQEPFCNDVGKNPNDKKLIVNYQKNLSIEEDGKMELGYLEFISPEGEIFICKTDIETGDCTHQDALIELGCSCKNDLALVHYACALKWFVSHGSTVCEICGYVATNIRSTDFKKVISSLREYDELRERTASGVPNPAVVHCSSGVVDPDALAAIRRQRLSEISLWFNPCNSNLHQNNNAPTTSHVVREQAPGLAAGEAVTAENPAAKWAVEGTGILLATGLLTVSLAWLIAPRVGKKTAKNGLHILLGGVCALAVVVFFRFVVLTRIKYGPARYWAILFVFWFLVFGIWASRSHSVHTT